MPTRVEPDPAGRATRAPALPLSDRDDRCITALLAPGEVVYAVREHAVLDRRSAPRTGDLDATATADAQPRGLPGACYVTSDRVLHVGATILEIELGRILEAIVASSTLWLLLVGGTGVTLHLEDPATFRSALAAARRGDVRVGVGG